MKRYIFLTPAIGNMGGSQMFVSNKCKFLQDRGWKVDVFFYQDFDVVLENLKEYRSNFIKELCYPFYYLTKNIINNIIELLGNQVCNANYDEIVIETHLYHLAYWGEMLANKIGGIHILYLLEEKTYHLTKKEAEFFEYKLKRWECLNGYRKTLLRFMGEYYKKEYEAYIYEANPICSNVVAKIENRCSFPKCDYTVLSVGRLEKPYVKTMLNEIKIFTTKYSNVKFNVIFVGASVDGSVEDYIKDLFVKVSNVNIILLGFLFPIPEDLIKQCDVGIAISNSVLVSAELGVPTISVDTQDYMALGVYGITTTNRFLREQEPQISISDLLEDIYLNKIFYTLDDRTSGMENEVDIALKVHLDFLEKGTHCKTYFDVMSIYPKYKFVFGNFKRIIRQNLNFIIHKK